MAEIHHNMDTLLQSDEFRDKMRRIPPHLKGVFVKAVEDLYDRESEKMLQLIWESRQEMRETFLTMEDEQNDLRSQSRMLEERRKEADRNYLRGRKSRTGRAASRLSTTSDITTVRGNVDGYNRRTPMMGSRMSGDSDLQLLSEASGARASSAGVSHRPAPTPVFVKSIEELRDELFKHLSTAETKVESERERQKELLEWLKAEKKNKQQEKVEKANELMEEMTQMEKIKAKDKERQEQRLKERLEEKKKLKEINSSLTPVESVQIETVVQIEPEPIGAAVIVEPSSEYKEKHKKKKHRHRDDEESNIGDGDGEERKERKEKKKKHKNKDRDKDGEAQLGIENEETKERRKEKKKHRHRHDDEAPDDATGEQDGDKERRREKKKHRHRRGSTTEGAENGLPETPEEAERRERKKEKKRSRKEKKRQEAANEEPGNEV